MQSLETITRRCEEARDRLNQSLALLKEPLPGQAQDVESRPVNNLPAEVSPQKAMMEKGISLLMEKIGQALTPEEKEWLGANLVSLPGFLSSFSGKAVIRLVYSEFKAWMEK